MYIIEIGEPNADGAVTDWTSDVGGTGDNLFDTAEEAEEGLGALMAYYQEEWTNYHDESEPFETMGRAREIEQWELPARLRA